MARNIMAVKSLHIYILEHIINIKKYMSRVINEINTNVAKCYDKNSFFETFNHAYEWNILQN